MTKISRIQCIDHIIKGDPIWESFHDKVNLIKSKKSPREFLGFFEGWDTHTNADNIIYYKL